MIKIPIHDGLTILAELRDETHPMQLKGGVRNRGVSFVYVGVGDDSGQDQIMYVETGPDMIVTRAIRDALTKIIDGEPGSEWEP